MSLVAIEALIRERLGLDPAALGPTALPRAVEKRMYAVASSDPDAYLRLLSGSPTEVGHLVGELVVAETWFFRGGRLLFDRLAEIVATRVAPVRILSLPCSTGEEPYSLAIALHERGLPAEAYRIDAVDLSPRHLERAAAARFSAFSFREPGPDIRPIHFVSHSDDWELLPTLRRLVHLRAGNVTDPQFLLGEPPYDLIVCRNLFIYLTVEGRLQAMTALDRLVVPDGWLCLSPGEADRLPPGRFVANGPTAFGLYRRAEPNLGEPRASATGWKPAPAALPRESQPTPSLTLRVRPEPLAPPPLPEPPAVVIASPLAQARALADAGKLADARVACERLLAENTELADAHSLLGVIHQAEGNPDAAAEAFRRALYLAPGNIEALSQLIVLCDRRGDAAQAGILRRRLARATREDTA